MKNENILKSLNEVLKNANIYSYIWSQDNGFTLQIETNSPNQTIPTFIKLYMHDWWIGNKNEWTLKIQSMGEGIEPTDTIQAFMLTKLLWKNTNIVNLDYITETLTLQMIFEDNTVLSINLSRPQEEYALLLIDESEKQGTWYLEINIKILQD